MFSSAAQKKRDSRQESVCFLSAAPSRCYRPSCPWMSNSSFPRPQGQVWATHSAARCSAGLCNLPTKCNLKNTGNWDRQGLQQRIRQRDHELYILKSQGNVKNKEVLFKQYPYVILYPTLKYWPSICPSLAFLAHILKPFDLFIEDSGNQAVTGLQGKKRAALGDTVCSCCWECYLLLWGRMTEISRKGFALVFF